MSVPAFLRESTVSECIVFGVCAGIILVCLGWVAYVMVGGGGM